MEYFRSGQDVFLRLEPGEELIDCLIRVAEETGLEFATIASGVGMIDGMELGFFCVNDNEYDTYRVAGVYDLSSISGNIAFFEGKPKPHVHIVANRPDFSTVSGHLMSCRAHITMEVGLTLFNGTGAERRTEAGRPATFITRT